MFIFSLFLVFFLTTENEFVLIAVADSAANSLEIFVDFVDGNLRVGITIDDVNTHAHDAASGVTTSGTSGNFYNFTLRAKLTSREAPSSVNLPFPFLRLARVLGMVFNGELMNQYDRIFVFWWVVSEMRDKMEGKGKIIETKKQEKQGKK